MEGEYVEMVYWVEKYRGGTKAEPWGSPFYFYIILQKPSKRHTQCAGG